MSARSAYSLLVVVLLAVGVAWAGSYDGDTVGRAKVFALCTAWAFAVNWIAFVPSYLSRTEHYYDLVGSITYVSTTLLAFILADERDVRAVVLSGLVIVWALRLGTFLFRRVRSAGGDQRFDTIKHSWGRFLVAWSIQALWVVFTGAAAWAAVTSDQDASFGVLGVLGLLIWLVGFGTEVVADRQKSDFRAEPGNQGRFIDVGLWSRSRHPNYVGEVVLWIGIAVIALPVLDGWQHATLLSPVFVYLLLTRISGVPMLEQRSDEKWGGQADYEAYKVRTPVFFPVRMR